jgi:hypothetical protein
MEQIIAKCGIVCTDCNAYKATIANSDELRKQTAEEWSRMFNTTIAPESINCRGCQGTDETSLSTTASSAESTPVLEEEDSRRAPLVLISDATR